jgi:hypothetical protein
MNRHVNNLTFISCLQLFWDFANLMLYVPYLNFLELVQCRLFDCWVLCWIDLCPYSCVVMLHRRFGAIAQLKHEGSAGHTSVTLGQIYLGDTLENWWFTAWLKPDNNDSRYAYFADYRAQSLTSFVIDVQYTADFCLQPFIHQVSRHPKNSKFG